MMPISKAEQDIKTVIKAFLLELAGIVLVVMALIGIVFVWMIPDPGIVGFPIGRYVVTFGGIFMIIIGVSAFHQGHSI